MVTTLMATLVTFGIFSQQDGSTIQGALSSAIAGIGLIAGAVTIAWKYIHARQVAKAAAPKTVSQAP